MLQDLTDCYRRAVTAIDLKRFGEARGICNDILAVLPDCPEAQAALGEIEARTGDMYKAVALYQKATERCPDRAEWLYRLSELYCRVGMVAQAVAVAEEAVRLQPTSPEPLSRLAAAYCQYDGLWLDDADEAIKACLLKALALDRDNAKAHMTLGEYLMGQGNWDAGFIEYEWRKKTPFVMEHSPRMSSAEWNGMELPTGRIVVLSEGGYGDVIQFCRYLPLVAKRCQEVILAVPPELAPIMPNGCTICTNYAEVPEHAAHVAMMSLPYIFHTTQDTIPDLPVLTVDSVKEDYFACELSQRANNRMRVGIFWKGRISHDFNGLRSMPLQALSPLLHRDDLFIVSLQKDHDASEADFLVENHVYHPKQDDWSDTAAVVTNLDCVVSIDTAVTHLAASLNVRTLLMLPQYTDWRWFRDLDYSPWYPALSIFRQTQAGWGQVVDQVNRELVNQG